MEVEQCRDLSDMRRREVEEWGWCVAAHKPGPAKPHLNLIFSFVPNPNLNVTVTDRILGLLVSELECTMYSYACFILLFLATVSRLVFSPFAY